MPECFLKDLGKGAKNKVQITEKIGGTGRTDKGAMYSKWTQLRKSKETKWIATLSAAYPCALNDKISDEINLINNEIICLGFPSTKWIYGRIGGTDNIFSNSLKVRKFIFKLNRYLIEDISNVMNFLRTQIPSINKKKTS